MKLYDPAGDALLLGRTTSPCSSTTRTKRRWVKRCTTPSPPRSIEHLEIPGIRPRQVPRQGLRPRDQRQRSRRRNDPDPRRRWSSSKVFGLLGINEADGQGTLRLPAATPSSYGAPPHGGIALGIDRWVMLFSRGKYDSIRDCHRLPQDPEGHRPDDRRPGQRRTEATQRTGNQTGPVTGFQRQLGLAARRHKRRKKVRGRMVFRRPHEFLISQRYSPRFATSATLCGYFPRVSKQVMP